jgi:hypothetical protein
MSPDIDQSLRTYRCLPNPNRLQAVGGTPHTTAFSPPGRPKAKSAPRGGISPDTRQSLRTGLCPGLSERHAGREVGDLMRQ